MDTARQILRYSIPGSLLLIFSALFFVLAEFACAPFDLPVKDILSPLSQISPAIAIGLALPAGFLVYQLYYSAYRPKIQAPSSLLGLAYGGRRGRLVTLDRGAETLAHLTEAQLDRVLEVFDAAHLKLPIINPSAAFGLYEMTPFGRKKKTVERRLRRSEFTLDPKTPRRRLMAQVMLGDGKAECTYSQAWHETWTIVRVLRDLTTTKHHPGLKVEHNVLSDLAHSLGAARRALTLGATFGVVAAVCDLYTRLEVDPSFGALLFGLGVCLVFFAWLWRALYLTRQSSVKAGLKALGWGLSAFLAAHPDVLDAIAGQTPDPTADLPGSDD